MKLRIAASIECVRVSILALVGLTLAACPAIAEPDLGQPLTVEECVEIALQQSDQLAEAQANLKTAHGSSVVSLSSYLPYISASAGWSRIWPVQERFVEGLGTQAVSPKYDGSISLSLRQNLIDLSTYADIRSSRQSYAASTEDLVDTEAVLKVTTQQQFYECLAAVKLADVEEEAVNVSREQLRRSETLFNLGSVARSDVLQAKVNLAEAEQILINRRNVVRVEHSRLAMVMGLDPRIDLVVDTTMVIPPIDPEGEIDQWIGDALLVRPDLRAARARLGAAEWSEKSARLGRLPSVEASWGYSRSSSSPDDWTLQDANYSKGWRWRLSASVPIFEGLGREGRIEQAVGQKRARQESLDREEKSVALEVKDSFLSIRKERESLRAAESSVRLAEENLRLQQALYESGAGTLLEWDNANLDLRRARVSLIQSQIALKLAHVRFWKAVARETP